MGTALAPRSRVKPPREFISSDQFLKWLEPGVHADLIAGEIVMHSPVSFKHAELLNFVDRLLAAYISELRLGKLYREVVAVRLGGRHTFLPDLCFFTNKQVAQLEPNFAPFAPTLVVEVISRESEVRDRRTKFSAYEAFGVEEYWILDPLKQSHQFYRRDGEFLRPHGKLLDDQMKSLVIPGFYLRRSWLAGPEFPEIGESLSEIRKKR